MKVLAICVLPPTMLPEADHAFHIIQNLAEAGVALDVLTAKGSVEINHPNIALFPVMERWDWREAGRLVRRMKRSKPDAILLYYLGPLYDEHPMITFAPTLARAAAPRIPFVTLLPQFYGASPSKFGRSGRILHKTIRFVLGRNTHRALGTVLRDSSRIIALSRPHLDAFAEALPEVAMKSVLIPPPAIMMLSPNTEEVREAGRRQLGVSEGMFLFAYFGYLYRGKGVDTLLRAFAQVAAQNGSVRLAVIGAISPVEGGLEYNAMLRQLVVELGLHDKVIFTGKFDWDSTQGSVYLRAANASVLPFDVGIQMNNSSFAAVVTHGLPVVTTEGPALEEPFVDGENICLCPPKDPKAMAAVMLKVMEDAPLRCRLHEGALRLAEDWFTWKSSTHRILNALGASAQNE